MKSKSTMLNKMNRLLGITCITPFPKVVTSVIGVYFLQTIFLATSHAVPEIGKLIHPIGDTLFLPPVLDRKIPTLISVPVASDVLTETLNSSVSDIFDSGQNETPEPTIIIIGGSLCAGVQNGGVYREAQLMSFPNLIARQMGVFIKQPLFEQSDGNGSGYKVLVRDKSPVYQYQFVNNNLGLDPESSEYKLKTFSGEVDNIALPYFNTRGAKKELSYFARLNKPSMESDEFIPFLKRLIPSQSLNDNTISYENLLNNHKENDFIIYDTGMDGHLQSALVGGDPSQLPQLEEGEISNKSEFVFLKSLAGKDSKGVLITIPDVLDFPYFGLYTLERLNELHPGSSITLQTNCGALREATKGDILLPGTKIMNLFLGRSRHEVLTAREVLSSDESCNELSAYQNVNWYNDYYIKNIAKQHNFALFDLHGLYKKITSGGYVTFDGVAVDPSFPNGNFYSDDAVHPSSFGQVVIANECIKAINTHYDSDIPLISTIKFLKQN